MTEDGKGDAAASAYGWLEGHATMNMDARWLLAEVERLTRDNASQRQQRIHAQEAQVVAEEHRDEALELVERLTGERDLWKRDFEEADTRMGAELDDLRGLLVAEQAEVGRLSGLVSAATEALEFYADPLTYFGIAIWVDSPAGDFAKDESEVDWPDGGTNVKPGKRARAALAALREDGEGK